ncbi:zinc transporter 9 [Bombus affinis]|uniref:Proton-coupled zinc antiporter SLC30A9, mitochondrial n=1 Tax=Bombus terrestris TaxID=30195 RepID=A0A9B2JQE8_BOMTE|nr:zinc transporter 9 [Bombus terrestris]XP_012173919.1 zinc transporter 9 [Bombus terrestris]XP_050583389.1 zinc transporter 9 [Bombus affinis]XP_050583390.1 zinc transporter 9 [Bombus affinis]
MLQRVPNLLKVFHNISHYNKECLYMFQIGYARRHINTLITYNYNTRYKVQIVANPQKIFTANNVKHLQEWRWILITISKPISVIAKVQKEETIDSSKSTQNNVQRIIELKEENLGQLKERNLDVKPDDNQTKEGQQNLKTEVKKKKTEKRVSSLERNFITPVRAMSDFLLKPSDLENLPKTKRRSPYEFEPPITVYWRKDVEAKAIEVWGSREILAKELLKKELQQKAYQQNIFTVKRRLRDYRREIGSKTQSIDQEGLFGRSGKVVLTAIVINGCNFLCKLCAWLYTGSHSMFSECIHSAADTCNQLILAYGIHKSVQTPNPDHPYGYTNMRYVSSLISGVGIFCVGTGLSIYHGIHGLLNPSTIESFYWAYFILAGSMVSEGATLLVAIQSIKKGAGEKRQTFKDYVLGGQDPSVNVVLMEDCAAVLGLVCAAACMGLTSYLENPMFDAIGSLLVGGLLGSIAGFIIHTNATALIGRSISQEDLDKINAELEADIMVRAIYDVKGIDMGNDLVRYKAELDFDGRELTRSYLEKHDLVQMLKEVTGMTDIKELEAFMLKHGEAIVDTLGGEIDRMELNLKKKHPEIRHCDLEIL